MLSGVARKESVTIRASVEGPVAPHQRPTMSTPTAEERATDRRAAESRVVAGLVAHRRLLWALALACGLADLLSTLWGLEQGFVEGNPVAARALAHYGAAGLVGLKGAAYLLAGVAYAALPTSLAVGIPLGLTLPAGFAVVHNLVLLT